MCTCGIYWTTGLVRVVRAIAMDGLRGVCSFQETSNFSLQNACTIYTPSRLRVYLASHSLQHVVFLILALLVGVKWPPVWF